MWNSYTEIWQPEGESNGAQNDYLGFGSLFGVWSMPFTLYMNSVFHDPRVTEADRPASSLRVIHNEPPLQQSASYQYWSKQSSEDIINSLAPVAEDPLTVTADGAIMQGNTRITVLIERGIEVDSLPRVEYVPWGMPELLEAPEIP